MNLLVAAAALACSLQVNPVESSGCPYADLLGAKQPHEHGHANEHEHDHHHHHHHHGNDSDDFPRPKHLKPVHPDHPHPHFHHIAHGNPSILDEAPGFPDRTTLKAYGEALDEMDWDAVKKDLRKLFTTSDPRWPADYGHYGGLFVRLAWHCSGSYRQSDGRGGCDGGNQRYDPERSWPDNTNLDKARKLLEPIKLKYGLGLSWGDLFVLAGTEAIADMGGPTLGFCAGRIDTVNNQQTVLLGPSPEQQVFAPCEVQGNCQSPLGTNTMGLIYVNPEGPMGKPDPQGAANTIRDVFGRMGLGDRDNVALIGGGHTFGKAHGACPAGAGPSPAEQENNPWPGNCGTGKGADTFTSGFEGPWTAHPTRWDNSYMKYLIEHDWEVYVGPGGNHQWRVLGGTSPAAPVANAAPMPKTDIALLGKKSPDAPPDKEEPPKEEPPKDKPAKEDPPKEDPPKEKPGKEEPPKEEPPKKEPEPRADGALNATQNIMMLTTDIALKVDPAYRQYVEEFANDEKAFGKAFADVWYELTTRDMGPATRCAGPDVPPPQTFQHTLPEPDKNKLKKISFKKVSQSIQKLLAKHEVDPFQFVRLAWQCASTFRISDYSGGCKGARIRFSPGKDWKMNQGLDQTLDSLNDIKDKYGDGLSWSDLIVLAGNVALAHQGGPRVPFCPGRTDATNGSAWTRLSFGNDEPPKSADAFIEINQRRGLTLKEAVALSWTTTSADFGPKVTKDTIPAPLVEDAIPTPLAEDAIPPSLAEDAIPPPLMEDAIPAPLVALSQISTGAEFGSKFIKDAISASDCDDILNCALKNHPELRTWAQYYVEAGDDVFARDFAAAWTKLMTADRFDGPTGNVCEGATIELDDDVSIESSLAASFLRRSDSSFSGSSAFAVIGVLVAVALAVGIVNKMFSTKRNGYQEVGV